MVLQSSCAGTTFDFSKDSITIASNGDKKSIEAADYFLKHLNKRNIATTKYNISRSDDINPLAKDNIIYFEVVPDLACDYEIINENRRLSIFARDKSIFTWLSYMLIDKIGDFQNIEVTDLPPHYINFTTSKNNFAFKYRDPHLLPNLNQDISGVLNTHNVDNDWGLWGHNLKKVFTDIPIEKGLATVNGVLNPDQFCFSAEETYLAISNFVLDEYGDGILSSKWFMVSPNDNDLVCTCSSCKKLGNTITNATPAVTNLITRLAKKYPGHHFFTTAYRTTKEPPTKPLLNSIGVLYSTIDLTTSTKIDSKDPSVVELVGLINKWKQQNTKVYLWDYISNFDDYLTPYPVLYRMQSHFSFYKSLGIEGLFLNGSGYDYSPFDDVKTYVLSALLINPELSISELTTKYFQRFYPVSGELLTNYYLDLEKETFSQNTKTPIYTSFRDASNIYFNREKFQKFYKELILIVDKLNDDEKEKISVLINALSYTQLQILYHNKEENVQERYTNKSLKSKESLEAISRLNKLALTGTAKNYKEESGAIASYLNEWNTIVDKEIESNQLISIRNLGKQADNTMHNTGLLYNNLLGFPSDFNQGWFLSGDDLHLECVLNEAGTQQDIHKIEIRFLINDRHRMRLPDKIEIIKQGVIVGQYSKNDLVERKNTASLKKSIQVPKGEKLEIRIMKNKEFENSVIACDEIQLY